MKTTIGGGSPRTGCRNTLAPVGWKETYGRRKLPKWNEKRGGLHFGIKNIDIGIIKWQLFRFYNKETKIYCC